MPESLNFQEMMRVARRIKKWEYRPCATFESIGSEVIITVSREEIPSGCPECTITAVLDGVRIGSAKEQEASGPLHELLSVLKRDNQSKNGRHRLPLEAEHREAVAGEIRHRLQ